MDTEKIKQMGRDYFKANPDNPCRPLSDEALQKVFLNFNGASMAVARIWKDGWHQAQYAASKEGRAIELLGRLFMEHPGKELRPAWAEAGEFLQEIGWKPKP